MSNLSQYFLSKGDADGPSHVVYCTCMKLALHGLDLTREQDSS